MPQPSPRSPAFNALMVTLEWIGLFVVAGLMVSVLRDVWASAVLNGPITAIALLGVPLGLLFANMFTGFGHFFADNFMEVDTPIIGHALVFRFRQHHEDQTIICNLTFRELNGGLALAMLPFILVTALFIPVAGTVWGAFLGLTGVSMALFGAGTNQIHRWTHDARCPAWVRAVQRTGIFLTPRHHATHHRAPHDVAFCITNGWLNPFLDRTRFWHHLADVLAAMGVHQAPESVMGWRAQRRHAAEAAESRRAVS